MLKLPKEPLESGKWVQLKLIRLEDGTHFLEPTDLERAKKRAGDFSYQPLTGPGKRFMAACAEFVVDFELTDLKLSYGWKDPHEWQDRADFTVHAKHGNIDIEIKSCPPYGKSIILSGDKSDFDYVVGIKALSKKQMSIRGYLPVKEVLGYPVREHGECKETSRRRGRPIPLDGLKPISELWKILKNLTH